MAINESIENITITFNTEALSFLQTDKIYSIEGDCLFGCSYNQSLTENSDESAEMIDFEQLIDAVYVKKENIEYINEFENFLNNFPTSEDRMHKDGMVKEMIDFEQVIDAVNDKRENINEYKNIINSFRIFEGCIHDEDGAVKEILNLDDITGYFDNVTNESNTMNAVNEECTIITRENDSSSSNNDNTNKLETQDADIFIDLTTDYAKFSSEASNNDIIHISSEDDVQSTNSDGYRSSDFEFITESDAELDEYIINFRRNKFDDIYNESKRDGVLAENAHKYTIAQINKEPDGEINNPPESFAKFNRQSDIDSNQSSNSFNGPQSISEISRHVLDPGEGPSGLNRPLYDYSNRDYRQNHLIPEGEGYLDLFRGAYNPILSLSDIIILENKSIRPSPMNIQYEGIGFDKQLIWRKCQQDSSEDECKFIFNKIF